MNVNQGGDPTRPHPAPPLAPPPPPRYNPQSDTQQVGALGTLIVVLGILAWIGFAVIVGFVISFGSCFKQECSSLESGAPVWAGLLAIILLLPFIVPLFRGRLRPVHVFVCGIPLGFMLIGFLLNIVGSLSR